MKRHAVCPIELTCKCDWPLCARPGRGLVSRPAGRPPTCLTRSFSFLSFFCFLCLSLLFLCCVAPARQASARAVAYKAPRDTSCHPRRHSESAHLLLFSPVLLAAVTCGVGRRSALSCSPLKRRAVKEACWQWRPARQGTLVRQLSCGACTHCLTSSMGTRCRFCRPCASCPCPLSCRCNGLPERPLSVTPCDDPVGTAPCSVW